MTNPSFIDPPALRSMDSSPIRGTTSDLLDMEKVAAHIERAVERGRYTGPPTVKEYLLRKQCVVEVDGVTYFVKSGAVQSQNWHQKYLHMARKIARIMH